MARRKIFRLVLIKPSHYDDNGYVIQWVRSAIPSNSLASLHALAADCAARQALGPDCDIDIEAFDETNTRIKPARIARRVLAADGGLVGLVGVQSNQFPRALDIARSLRASGVAVVIGGFHISGCLAMLPELPSDIKEALAMGISIFAGEAEGRIEQVLQDAWLKQLKPIYNYMDDLPALDGAVYPILPPQAVARTAGSVTSFDAGRGCPFQCSFCTIINVQGRKSRHRTADDVEQIVRANLAHGVKSFFITDDNFARNRNWEAIFDRMIELREQQKLNFSFIMQVDTMCHKIPGFIEKAARAGCHRVFIGLENINPDNLLSAKKKQNRITEYRTMLQRWKAVRVVTYCGYILGFPADRPELILGDIEIIKKELPVDLLEFFCLTPLPGSEDHKRLLTENIWMDPDMNKYDLEHVTTGHSQMSSTEWQDIYHRVWAAYYTPEHIERVMRRAAACGMSAGNVMFYCLWFYGCKTLEGIHPLEGGYLRRMYRRDRRPGLAREWPGVFHAKYLGHLWRTHWGILSMLRRFNKVRKEIKADPNRRVYNDLALTPVEETDTDSLELFTVTESTKAALKKHGSNLPRQARA
ncbi:MAG TPA: radical SAM protein [Candidatus Binatia bacterium]|nr:radical SAM protein [Candidatus Binatia bacterium]